MKLINIYFLRCPSVALSLSSALALARRVHLVSDLFHLDLRLRGACISRTLTSLMQWKPSNALCMCRHRAHTNGRRSIPMAGCGANEEKCVCVTNIYAFLRVRRNTERNQKPNGKIESSESSEGAKKVLGLCVCVLRENGANAHKNHEHFYFLKTKPDY